MPARSKASQYWTLLTLSAGEMLGQRSRVLSWFFSTMILIGITLILYVTAYQSSSAPALPLSAAVWSLVVANFMRLSWRHLTGMVAEDVQSGNVTLHMRYPVSYLVYAFVTHAGLSTPIILGIPFYALFAYFAGGWPVVLAPAAVLPIAFVMAIMSTILLACMYMFVGILAFWMENVMPVLWIIDKSMLVLGGSVVPLALLPAGVREVAEYVPFAVVGFPARVFEPTFLEQAGRLLAIEVGWLLAIGALFWWAWTRAVRRIEVNGG